MTKETYEKYKKVLEELRQELADNLIKFVRRKEFDTIKNIEGRMLFLEQEIHDYELQKSLDSLKLGLAKMEVSDEK